MPRAVFVVCAAATLVAGTFVLTSGASAGTGADLYAYADGQGLTGFGSGCAAVTDHSRDGCSLFQALQKATPGATVLLATPGSTLHYVGNWVISVAHASASTPVTIKPASGVTSPTLDGNNGSSTGCSTASCSGTILNIEDDTSVSITDITIEDANNHGRGSTGKGGAINNDGGTLVVTGSTFTKNSGGDGPAIDNADGGSGTLQVRDSTFTGNETPSGDGGAIDNGDGGSGTLTVRDSTFTDNHALFEGGAIDNGDKSGHGTLVVSNSTFTHNSAADGAAIDNGDYRGSGTATVTNSTFANNGAPSSGGAINNGFGHGTLTVSGSTFINNSSAAGGAIDNGQGSGSSSHDVATVRKSTFVDNHASSFQGGAIANGLVGHGTLVVTGSTFSRNTAAAGGPAIANAYAYPDSPNRPGNGTVMVAADVFADACGRPAGTWQDGGYNVGVDTTCFNGGTADKSTMTTGELGALASNGGPTQTVALLAGNPALGLIANGTSVTINGKSQALCPTTDQRGVTSTTGAACNAGAVQSAASTITVTADPSSTTLGKSVRLTAAVSSSVSTPKLPVPAGTVSFTEGGTALCKPVTVAQGSAVCTSTKLPAGKDTVTARYASTNGYAVATDMTSVGVHQPPPAFTSPDHASFTVGKAGSFTPTASGAPTITESGALPRGLTFTAGTLSGTPATGTAGAYYVTLTAANGVPPKAVQSFTVRVAAAKAATTYAAPKGTGNCLGASAACPLEDAVTVAGDGGTVMLAGGTYPGVSLNLTKSVTLQAEPNTTPVLQGKGRSSQTYVLTVETSATAHLVGLTVTNGAQGIAIYGAAEINDSAFTDNNNGIRIDGAAGVTTVTDSTVAHSAGDGIVVQGLTETTVVVTDSTITANGAAGIDVGYRAQTTVTDSTVTDNVAGIYVGQAVPTATVLAGDIVAGNKPRGDCDDVSTTPIADAGGNIDSDGSCVSSSDPGRHSVSGSSTIISSLGTLTNNGGPTDTIALKPGSPALGIVPGNLKVDGTALCSLKDQRGKPRSKPCDAGAYELQVQTPPAFTSADHATFTTGKSGSFAVTATGMPAPTIEESGTLPQGVGFVGGTLSGTPAAGTAGRYSLIFTAKNGASPEASQSFTLTVAKQAQSITFSPPATATVGSSYLATATASSGLAVGTSIDSSSEPGVCRPEPISPGYNGSFVKVGFTGVGTCVLDANQPGDGTYARAPQVRRSITVLPAADLAVTVSGDANLNQRGRQASRRGNGLVSYTVTVTNKGPNAAQDVAVSVALPATATGPRGRAVLAEFVSDGGHCSGTPRPYTASHGQTVSCDLGAIANGKQKSVTFTFALFSRSRARSPYAFGFTDAASASSSTFDPDTSNNAGKATLTYRMR